MPLATVCNTSMASPPEPPISFAASFHACSACVDTPSVVESLPSCACPIMLDSMNDLNPAPMPNAASAPNTSTLSRLNAPAAFFPLSAISLVCLSDASPILVSEVVTSFCFFSYSPVSKPRVMTRASITFMSDPHAMRRFRCVHSRHGFPIRPTGLARRAWWRVPRKSPAWMTRRRRSWREHSGRGRICANRRGQAAPDQATAFREKTRMQVHPRHAKLQQGFRFLDVVRHQFTDDLAFVDLETFQHRRHQRFRLFRRHLGHQRPQHAGNASEPGIDLHVRQADAVLAERKHQPNRPSFDVQRRKFGHDKGLSLIAAVFVDGDPGSLARHQDALAPTIFSQVISNFSVSSVFFASGIAWKRDR